MDCKTAKEMIYIFDALGQDDKERVLAHAQVCEECKDELIYAAKLRDSLGSLDEVEPPLGLARSAIARAKKRGRIPPVAYFSVAAAAVIAVAVVVSSTMFNFGAGQSNDEPMQMAVEEQMLRTNDEFAAKEPVAEMAVMEEAQMAPMEDMAVDDAAEEVELAPMATSAAKESEENGISMAKVDTSFIYVSADMTEFAQELEVFFTEYDIYVEYAQFDGGSSMTFFVGNLQFDSFVELLELRDIPYDKALVPGITVEVTFVK